MSRKENPNVCGILTSTNEVRQETIDSLNWFMEESQKYRETKETEEAEDE